MSSCIVAGYTVHKTTPLDLSMEQIVSESKKSSSFLVHMLRMMESQHIKSNETARDTYRECLQLKEYLSEQLWSVTDQESISAIQDAMDELTHVLLEYESSSDNDA
ncbi:hypothetical protein BY458DRAFT_520530 [Sporodiniella umbellata]|nr:hypothetical protein BY458DRAFT_520530 [Sporodiniella umbellata]